MYYLPLDDPSNADYEEDYSIWLSYQSAHLQEKNWDKLDIPNLMGGNPNPKQKLKPVYGDEALSSKTVALRLPREIDEFVRSLPNKTEWLRKAIADAYEREQHQSS